MAIVWTFPDPDNPLIIKNSSEEQTWYYITSIVTDLDTKFNPLTEALFQFDEATRYVLYSFFPIPDELELRGRKMMKF